MIRTTHLSAVREALINNRLECTKINARIPFNTVAGIRPVCLTYKKISRMEGTVILLERPSKLLMETIFRDLTRPDHWMMKRTSDCKILSLGLEPQFFSGQAIWLSIPTPRDFTDMMHGVMDDGGHPMDTRTSFMD